MRPYPALLLVVSSLLAPLAPASVIYSHTFDGSSATALNGSAVDGSSQTWTANANFKADGSAGAASGSAWLPYAFGTGIYTVTAEVDVTATTSTNFALISFTNASALSSITGDLSGHASSYATFGLRGAGDWDFWGGNATLNAVDGASAGTGFRKTNTIKLVLDTTTTQWTVTASLLNASGVETFADLNGAASGVAYSFAANPAAFTGVGFFLRSGVVIDSFSLTASPVPEPSASAALLGVCALGFVAFRRRR